jgi:hypothetical protein
LESGTDIEYNMILNKDKKGLKVIISLYVVFVILLGFIEGIFIQYVSGENLTLLDKWAFPETFINSLTAVFILAIVVRILRQKDIAKKLNIKLEEKKSKTLQIGSTETQVEGLIKIVNNMANSQGTTESAQGDKKLKDKEELLTRDGFAKIDASEFKLSKGEKDGGKVSGKGTLELLDIPYILLPHKNKFFLPCLSLCKLLLEGTPIRRICIYVLHKLKKQKPINI